MKSHLFQIMVAKFALVTGCEETSTFKRTKNYFL